MWAALRTGQRRWVGRLSRLVRSVEATEQLGLPLSRAFDRRWAAAVDAVRFTLLPVAVRQNLRVAVDVGANRGDWSAALIRLAQPRLLVAFEPNPLVFERLKARLEPLGARCVQAAVGASEGQASLNVEVQSELSSLRALSSRGRQIHRIEGAPTRRVDVPVVTLDRQLADVDEVSLLKLDVQGFESEVIAGATAVLARTRCLVTEVMYERDYYAGALPCLELARRIEQVSPLRLSCVSAPALSPDGRGAWADAVFIDGRL
jgi:FkbM family methyltransferase